MPTPQNIGLLGVFSEWVCRTAAIDGDLRFLRLSLLFFLRKEQQSSLATAKIFLCKYWPDIFSKSQLECDFKEVTNWFLRTDNVAYSRVSFPASSVPAPGVPASLATPRPALQPQDVRKSPDQEDAVIKFKQLIEADQQMSRVFYSEEISEDQFATREDNRFNAMYEDAWARYVLVCDKYGTIPTSHEGKAADIKLKYFIARLEYVISRIKSSMKNIKHIALSHMERKLLLVEAHKTLLKIILEKQPVPGAKKTFDDLRALDCDAFEATILNERVRTILQRYDLLRAELGLG